MIFFKQVIFFNYIFFPYPFQSSFPHNSSPPASPHPHPPWPVEVLIKPDTHQILTIRSCVIVGKSQTSQVVWCIPPASNPKFISNKLHWAKLCAGNDQTIMQDGWGITGELFLKKSPMQPQRQKWTTVSQTILTKIQEVSYVRTGYGPKDYARHLSSGCLVLHTGCQKLFWCITHLNNWKIISWQCYKN